VIAGTVGGGGRVEFTVIGDTVNTASRVEAATRETGDDVLITEATRLLLRRVQCDFDQRPPMPLKGKRQVVRLWAPRVSHVAGAGVPGEAAEGARAAVGGAAGGARAGAQDGAGAPARAGTQDGSGAPAQAGGAPAQAGAQDGSGAPAQAGAGDASR
jgi:hypothetical protein